MTMHYRLLVVLGFIWYCKASTAGKDGRSFIGVRNAIDLHNVQPSESVDYVEYSKLKNFNLNNQIDSINKPLNSINHSGSHQTKRKRRSNSQIVQRHLGERYPSNANSNKTFDEAVKFLNENNVKAIEFARQTNIASWNYDSNLTETNKQLMLEQSLKQAQFDLETWTEAKSFAWKKFDDKRIRRWFEKLTFFNNLAIGETKYKELNLINADLVDTYSKAKICKYKSKDDCNLELEPDLNALLKESRDYDELKWIWKAWRDASGKKMRSKYKRYVQLMNEQANHAGFQDAGEVWREDFKIENGNFEQQLEEQLQKIEPLYKLLHAYVRKKLREIYGSDRIEADGPIPSHILGNMWSQDWSNANLNTLLPFPKRVKTDLSRSLNEKNLTATELFKLGESFFKSLGLPDLTEEFWRYSILEKPQDIELVCHASAWDFDGKDVRIKQCTKITHEHFVTAHHELGHIYYYLAYANQPFVFRNSPNSAWHESIGDCIALSVQLPKHLKTIGLLDNTNNYTAENDTLSEEQDELNFLMQMALQKISFLPFGYLIDKYRWDVFNGNITEDELNSRWWKLRGELQGVCPPVLRTEEDFDAGAKYHIPASVPYLRYFVSHILQFQFHKCLCESAGYKGKLSQCDIYGSKEAGKRLFSTLSLGSSVPWPEALKIISNNTEEKINAEALIEYFEPLTVWLKKQLTDDDQIGWKIKNPNICPNH